MRKNLKAININTYCPIMQTITDNLTELKEFLNELNDRIVRRYQGSDKDQAIAYGMEIVYFDLLDLIEGKTNERKN